MLGLKRGTVKLALFHKKWVELYKQERKFLLAVLEGLDIEIEHVGSTAISGVSAKPIIDIMIAVLKDSETKKVYNILKKAGYKNKGAQGVKGRKLFVKGPERKRTHYLHVIKKISKEYNKLIFFRDYLKSHKKARDEYNELKKQLAEKFSHNRPLYTKAKSDFINKVIKEAKNGTSRAPLLSEEKE